MNTNPTYLVLNFSEKYLLQLWGSCWPPGKHPETFKVQTKKNSKNAKFTKIFVGMRCIRTSGRLKKEK